MSDRLAFWGLLIVVVAVWVAAALGVFGQGILTWIIPVVVTLIGALLGALQLDRGGRVQTGKFFDENKANFYAPMTNETWQVPTSYIDHRTGSGSPPGTESYDAGAVGDLLGEDTTLADNEDPAP